MPCPLPKAFALAFCFATGGPGAAAIGGAGFGVEAIVGGLSFRGSSGGPGGSVHEDEVQAGAGGTGGGRFISTGAAFGGVFGATLPSGIA